MSVQPVDPITPSAIDPYDPTTAPPKSPTPSPGDSVSFSGPGRFLSDLQNLEQTDPARAKQILADLAGRLRTAAAKGGADSSQMTAMADKLQQAADTGDLSGLQPAQGQSQQGGHHHHGHHHHHAAQTYSQNAASTDPLAALSKT
jgi:hypothetical protein